jgi:hypothetical protein
MKNRFVLSSSIAAFVISLAFILAASAKEPLDCAVVYEKLFAHSEKVMAALQKETDFFYWGRARVAIEATPNEDLEKIFGGRTKKEFEDFYYGVKSGIYKASPKENKMLDELWHMIEELGTEPFFGNVPDRGFAIRQALQVHDAKLGYSGDPAYGAQLTEKALGRTDVEILLRAISEHDQNAKYPNSRWYDPVVRFFSPHYDKVRDIIEVNDSLRRQLQKMYLTDQPALEALPKYTQSLGLSNPEIQELQNLASGTAAQLSEVRGMIAELYGREIAANSPLPRSEIRIRELAKRAKALGAKQNEAELTSSAEGEMDTIDRVIGGAWNRKNKETTGMPVTEKHDIHLQIRNPQYRRETPERRASYLAITEQRSPEKSEYNVKTEWTVTVQYAEPKQRPKVKYRKKSDGSTEPYTDGETETYIDYYSRPYEMSRTDRLRARYEEVLVGGVQPGDHIDDLPPLPPAETRGMYAVSASNGSPSIASYDKSQVDWIVGQAEKARTVENGYREQIAKVTSLVDGITNDAYKAAKKATGETAKLVGALDKEEASLRQSRGKLASYLASESGAIRTRWQHDRENDFKDRNQSLLVRYDHMINRIVHLKEQMSRAVPSLEIEFNLPNHEPRLAHLESIKKKNRKIILSTAGGAAAVGVGATAYTYQDEIMSQIRKWTSEEEPRNFRGN